MGYSPQHCKKSDTTEHTDTDTHTDLRSHVSNVYVNADFYIRISIMYWEQKNKNYLRKVKQNKQTKKWHHK